MENQTVNVTRTIAALFFLTLCPLLSQAQVTDLPPGPYGGQFRDESTGKIWLDYDVTNGKTLSEKIAFLQNTPFRLASSSEIQSIAQPSVVFDSATGAFTLCQYSFLPDPIPCKFGVFDDSETGSNPGLVGVMGGRQDDIVTVQNDSSDHSAAVFYGTWAIQRGPALRPGTSSFGADFDGDGKDEKIVWRPSEGNWYIRFSVTDELMIYQWGLPGDIPLIGDYDGDLIPDLVVWRPSNGTWYVKTSKSLYDASKAVTQQFGLPGDVPMKGDFDGDGRLDYAVWRPANGSWYVLQSSNQQPIVTQWGLSNDIPVTGGKNK